MNGIQIRTLVDAWGNRARGKVYKIKQVAKLVWRSMLIVEKKLYLYYEQV
jgi:hypothetical protein